MPTYFDPISQIDDVNIDNGTFIFLVGTKNKFAIRAISSGIELLEHEPMTRANAYWTIDTMQLINEQYQNPIIFPDNKLTTQPLGLNQVIEYLGINPHETVPTPFSKNVIQQQQPMDDMMRNSHYSMEDDLEHELPAEIDIAPPLPISFPPFSGSIVNSYEQMTMPTFGGLYQPPRFFFSTDHSFADPTRKRNHSERSIFHSDELDSLGFAVKRRPQPDGFFSQGGQVLPETNTITNHHLAFLQTMDPTFLTFVLQHHIPMQPLFYLQPETSSVRLSNI